MKNGLVMKMHTLISKVAMPVAFICVVLLSAVPGSVKAQEGLKEDTPVEVKYLGQVNYQPIFQIDINNEAEEELFVVLKDEDGSVLYTEKFKDKKFSKKFQFNKADLQDLKIIMTLASKKEKINQVFLVNKTTSVVEDIVVSKVR